MTWPEINHDAFFGGIVQGIVERPLIDRGVQRTEFPSVKDIDMPSREEIVAWLSSLHLSLWGNYFTLEKERPLDCAQWILGQITSFLEWRKTQ